MYKEATRGFLGRKISTVNFFIGRLKGPRGMGKLERGEARKK
jgi:hypothetical protein